MRPTNKFISVSFLMISVMLISCFSALSQPKLILTKLGKRKQITFNEGDEIWLKINNESNYVGGLIIGLRDSTIKFRYFEIPVKEITEVNIDGMSFGGFNVGQYGPVIMGGGPIYLGIDYLNQGDVTTSTLIQAASITTIGYVLWKIRRKKFKVRKRNRLQIVR